MFILSFLSQVIENMFEKIHFLTCIENFLARMSVPTEIFRLHNSQLNENQDVEFNLQFIPTNHSQLNSTQIILDKFQMKIDSTSHAHLYLIEKLNPFDEIQLYISMKSFTNQILSSISVMKLFIYVSQYDFYP